MLIYCVIILTDNKNEYKLDEFIIILYHPIRRCQIIQSATIIYCVIINYNPSPEDYISKMTSQYAKVHRGT